MVAASFLLAMGPVSHTANSATHPPSSARREIQPISAKFASSSIVKLCSASNKNSSEPSLTENVADVGVMEHVADI